MAQHIRKRAHTHQQSHQNDVREQGREPDHFAGALDALDETEERNDPAERQAEHQLPAWIAPVFECRTADSQHVLTAISRQQQQRTSDVAFREWSALGVCNTVQI